jgi:hypothetical protein
MQDDAHYAAMEATARRTGDFQSLAFALRHRSELALSGGDAAAGLALAHEAADLYRQQGIAAELGLANALRLKALAETALSNTSAAEQHWLEARVLYLSLGVEAGVVECDAHLAP